MTKPLNADFVTDHALVRYMERVLDIDVEAVRDLIAFETAYAVQAKADALTTEGKRYVIKNGRVITVLLTKNKMVHLKRLRTGERHD
ncbi:hypothetical protein [uncultured Cohaesibacter sp.]|uniref:hypothetical protein n=1 Tax=uncultured Cohaesibacter sp. TaxID=1002546 RepID=UPI002AAB9BD5|nr:hypothetical protein [uncultured Cohaesibacter sp.]